MSILDHKTAGKMQPRGMGTERTFVRTGTEYEIQNNIVAACARMLTAVRVAANLKRTSTTLDILSLDVRTGHNGHEKKTQ